MTTEELREGTITKIEICGRNGGYTMPDVRQNLDSLIAAARAEGAVIERNEWMEARTAIAEGEEVLTLYTHRGLWDGKDTIFADEDILIIPAKAVLAPKVKP